MYLIAFLFIILIVAECLGDYCFHYSISHKHMKNSVYCAGVLFYVFIGLIYFQILKRYDNLAVPNAIYQCLSVVAVTLLSLVVLKEKISMIKMMGILIILVGLGIVSFSK
tara:strand:- start:289 stop:618 length:330 start_codon:yes stop_codon:yes gene_type:complete